MSRRPPPIPWCALAAEELEEAALTALAVERGLLPEAVIGATKKKGAVAAALGRKLDARAYEQLVAEARAHVFPCPACAAAFVRAGRPEDAACVRCGAGPPLNEPETRIIYELASTPDTATDAPVAGLEGVPPAPSSASTPQVPGGASASSRLRAQQPPGASASGRLRPAPPPPGERLGSFLLERELGRGGMGIVYLARRDDGTRVALKLAANVLSPDRRLRFLREGQAAARLDHPAIVRVLEAGESSRGPWIALELVDGVALGALAAAEPIPLERSLAILEQVARAMDHAHRRGVVHRDLKPGNILIARDGQVKVADFGLAKDLESNVALTLQGVALGTPSFMPPEQAGGRADQAGVAADIYSIGAMLYLLATMSPPFRGSRADMLAAAMRGPPEPPTKRAPHLRLPPDLDLVIARALAARPSDRYATALELAQDLAALRHGERPRHALEPPAPADPVLSLAAGDRIGPYELRYPVGRGGAAVVFKARAKDGSAVAVKVLRDADEERLARFDREVRLLGLLAKEEEGFVPLLEHGRSPAGPWLAMPFVSGGTLRDRLERGPLAPELAEKILLQVAQTVARAHARGVAHRDLKPENVLFDDADAPLVADLGLARRFSRDLPGGSASVTVSIEGRVYGTAGYVAPEQLEDAHKAGPPADVFALGAILYECISGEPAFRADNLVALLTKLARAEYVPLAKLTPGLPAWLDAIVVRSLRADPAKRFADAAELARALEAGPRGTGLARNALEKVRNLLGDRGAEKPRAKKRRGAPREPEGERG